MGFWGLGLSGFLGFRVLVLGLKGLRTTLV